MCIVPHMKGMKMARAANDYSRYRINSCQSCRIILLCALAQPPSMQMNICKSFSQSRASKSLE
jgi:hypothetical protein